MTVAAYAKKAGYDVLGITIFYGQRLKTEIDSTKKVAEKLEIHHKVVDISLYKELAWYSALTNIGSFQVPKKQDVTEIKKEIPIIISLCETLSLLCWLLHISNQNFSNVLKLIKSI